MVAGAGYGLYGPLGWLQRWIFGSRHREIWAAPVEVERFDLTSEAGGLTPIGADSGVRSGELYLRGADGSLYTFNQIAADLSHFLPVGLHNDFGAGLAQDLQSGRHPGAPFVVPPLAAATGLGPLPTPRLGVLPLDTSLDRFGTRFSGTVGFLAPGIISRFRTTAGVADSAIPSSELIELLQSENPPSVDRLTYLRERLFDVFLGSWDPVPQDWLWIRDSSGVWKPRPTTPGSRVHPSRRAGRGPRGTAGAELRHLQQGLRHPPCSHDPGADSRSPDSPDPGSRRLRRDRHCAAGRADRFGDRGRGEPDAAFILREGR